MMEEQNNLEKGQGLVEYALLFVFVALLLIFLVVIFGEEVRDTYVDILDTIKLYVGAGG